MNELPTFLRIPPAPYRSTTPTPAISSTDLVELWCKTGVLMRVDPYRRPIARSDFYGLLGLVAALSFSLGYWLAF